MDEKAHSFNSQQQLYSLPQSPKIYLPKPSGSSASSGLTLVIPSLKSLKASQSVSAGKPKHRSASILPASPAVYQDVVDVQEKKIPRPVKLKPLKEVLSKLIFQLKKKDDYAFFLHPVDVASVPGYADIVKRPMDLGTMSDKVSKGKYRSLEEFASDFKLVTNNAKMFNPPGTIYHTEADRLEAWGLDHISKAASTVIQYETDWNIEIEKDDDGPTLNIDEEEEESVGVGADSMMMDVDGSASLRERSVSVASQSQSQSQSIPQQAQGPTRRGPRGPYKKHGQNGQSGTGTTTLSESLEPDGGLPGSKDGLGSFPAGSDWAKTMVALKLKGKRYKTKKERLRIEREGPPLLPDGSLDYTEMEDPFSVLSFFVPDPPSRPHIVPLYQPLYNPPPPPPPTQGVSDPSSSSTPQPQPPVVAGAGGVSTPLAPSTSTSAPPFPSATSVPLDHPPLTLPFLQQIQDQGQSQSQSLQKTSSGSGKPSQSQTQTQSQGQTQRRHWTITRNPTWRHKGKEREDKDKDRDELDGMGMDVPVWRMPREPCAVDWGSYAVLGGVLAEEMGRRRGVGQGQGVGGSVGYGGGGGSGGGGGGGNVNERTDQEMAFELIRESLDCEKAAKRGNGDEDLGTATTTTTTTNGNGSSITSGYWTAKRAAEGEEYVRDLVYGGVDGLAYARSLAEFVDGDTFCRGGDEDIDHDHDPQVIPEPQSGPKQEPEPEPEPEPGLAYNPYLGMKLAKWVETNIVDPLTEGRHSLLKETGLEIAHQQNQNSLLHLLPHFPSPATAALPLPTPSPAAPQQHPHPAMDVDPRQGTVSSQVAASLHLYPAALVAMSSLLHIRMHKIDMGALIKTPNELFLSEEEWVGKALKERRRKARLVAEANKEKEKEKDGGMNPSTPRQMEEDAMEVEEPEQTWAGVDASLGLVKDRGVNGRLSAYEQEGPEELSEVLEYVANLIVELDRRTRLEKTGKKVAAASVASASSVTPTSQNGNGKEDAMKVEEDPSASGSHLPLPPQTPPVPPPSPAEDPKIRDLRLNLLALAKRAPLDTIARLPKDLVPEHIRHFVPTLGSTG